MEYLKSFLKKAEADMKVYSSKINWFVFVLIVFFTVGSWIDINGMWCELPIIVHELPEGWKLPSILSAIMQLSQLGPVVFLLAKCLFPKRVTFTAANYCILVIGSTSCFLIAFLWRKTLFFGGEERSIALYILQFTLGLLDGTSSVTFLPFIGKHYKKEYIIPTYVGESLSAMIPSMLGIIQGVGEDPGCQEKNITNGSNTTVELEPLPLKPRFSVMIYFLILCFLLIVSTSAFSILNFSKLSRNERKMSETISVTDTSDEQLDNTPYSSTTNFNKSVNESGQNMEFTSVKGEKPTQAVRSALLVIIFCVSFIAYGLLPALQSYSTLPYGNSTFHLSINIAYVLLPIVILLSIWSYNLSCKRIIIEFAIALLLSLYIICISTTSPCPPLQDSVLGPVLMVSAWVITTCLFMRIRCCIAAKLEVCGQNTLLLIGFLTMFGQMISGLIMYFVVNTFNLFQDAPACQDVVAYCKSRV